jgi:hypothetical protein
MVTLRKALSFAALLMLAACSDSEQSAPSVVSGAVTSTSGAVTVVPPATTLVPGTRLQMTAVAPTLRGGTLTATSFKWSSSSPAVATITSRGILTAVTVGTTVLTASWFGYRGSLAVTVAAAPPVVDTAPSVTVSTFTSTPDTALVGTAATLIITPKNAAGATLGSGLTVTLTKTGGTGTDVLSAVAFVATDSTYRATFTPMGAGTTTLTAAIGGVAMPATRAVVGKATTVVTPPPVVAQSWTFCTNAGGVTCDFSGQRDIRLVATSGAQVVQTAFNFIGCNHYAFTTPLPAGSVDQRCDYGALKTEVVTNPTPGMAGLPGQVTVPLGDWGESTQMFAASNSTPTPTPFDGSFRMVCNLTKMAAFDPVVFPGQALAGHLHAFFGNAGINPNSTPQSLATTGNSTCMGGIVNRSAYWVPALFDVVTGEVQVPSGKFYYKSGYNLDPTKSQPVPAGLRMIAGDKNATASQNNGPNYAAGWNCELVWNQQASVDGFIPNCGVGDAVVLMVNFPECWDGVNLDSPDHKSHMAYATYRNQPQVSSCPSTHPVQLPRISEIFSYRVTANSRPMNWRLSSDTYASSTRGGLSAHADWMDGWSRDAMTTFVRMCLNAQKDCGVGTLGDGRDLVYRRP